jgi:hypothetical protein
VDTNKSDEPKDSELITAETLPAATGMTAAAVSARPRSGSLPLMAIGAAGVVAAAGIVLALSSRPEATPARAATMSSTAPPAASTGPAPLIVESAPPPTWIGQRRAGWGPDGSRTITFELQATHDVPVWMSRARPVLVVQCASRMTHAFVALGTSAKFENDAFRRTVQLQWDDGPLTVQQWQGSESGQELFAADGVGFVRQLARGNRLRFGFTPFNAPAVTVEFAVQGFEPLAGLVAKTCGWRLDA